MLRGSSEDQGGNDEPSGQGWHGRNHESSEVTSTLMSCGQNVSSELKCCKSNPKRQECWWWLNIHSVITVGFSKPRGWLPPVASSHSFALILLLNLSPWEEAWARSSWPDVCPSGLNFVSPQNFEKFHVFVITHCVISHSSTDMDWSQHLRSWCREFSVLSTDRPPLTWSQKAVAPQECMALRNWMLERKVTSLYSLETPWRGSVSPS